MCVLCDRLDVAVRMERDMRDPPPKGQHAHHAFRPESPPWLVDHRSVSVATPSGRTVSKNMYSTGQAFTPDFTYCYREKTSQR